MSRLDAWRNSRELDKLKESFNKLQIEQVEKLKATVESLEVQLQESGKRIATPAQQLLLLHHLGFLKPIIELNIQQKQKGKLLAALLNIGAENAEKNMNKIGGGKSVHEKEENYEFLEDFFFEIGLKDKAKECGAIKRALSDKKKR